jgi:hypothetical protein
MIGQPAAFFGRNGLGRNRLRDGGWLLGKLSLKNGLVAR